MKKDNGVTLLELLTIIAIIGIISALAYPSFRLILNRINLKKDVNQIYGDFIESKANAMEKGCDWVIIFTPDDNSYTIFSDNGIVSPGPDGSLFTADDIINEELRNNGILDNIDGEEKTTRKVKLKFARFGVLEGVDRLACLNQEGFPPGNGIDFPERKLRFSYLGVARSGGAVYVTNNRDQYAISVIQSTGKISVCKWTGNLWK